LYSWHSNEIFNSDLYENWVDVETTPSFAFSEPKGLPIEIENT